MKKQEVQSFDIDMRASTDHPSESQTDLVDVRFINISNPFKLASDLLVAESIDRPNEFEEATDERARNFEHKLSFEIQQDHRKHPVISMQPKGATEDKVVITGDDLITKPSTPDDWEILSVTESTDDYPAPPSPETVILSNVEIMLSDVKKDWQDLQDTITTTTPKPMRKTMAPIFEFDERTTTTRVTPKAFDRDWATGLELWRIRMLLGKLEDQIGEIRRNDITTTQKTTTVPTTKKNAENMFIVT